MSHPSLEDCFCMPASRRSLTPLLGPSTRGKGEYSDPQTFSVALRLRGRRRAPATEAGSRAGCRARSLRAVPQEGGQRTGGAQDAEWSRLDPTPIGPQGRSSGFGHFRKLKFLACLTRRSAVRILHCPAGVVQWQNGCFPSSIRGFDSLHPLPPKPSDAHYSLRLHIQSRRLGKLALPLVE